MEITNINIKEKKAYNKARSKAKRLREFYSHIRTYLIVNSIFFLINMLSSPDDLWVLYPVIGWGFCLTIHAIETFGVFKNFDEEWEERKTKELMETDKNN